MGRFTAGLLLFTAVAAAAPADLSLSSFAGQQVLSHSQQATGSSARKLQGRFLHITDIHADAFYKFHSSPDDQCHARKGSAGYYGAEITSCDSPFSLVNATFEWINDHVKDDIDFVVWTGDSARHDNDENHPRTDKQVIGLNEFIVAKFVEVFGKTDNIDDPNPNNDFIVPIVPTLGNNDILPHNIFPPGPNKWTRRFGKMWNPFVPQEQRHSFARGGWFFSEVIPNRLAVFSLNTLYFFDSNSAVDGCDPKSEPGYEHMEWLRIQLQFLRERGMKAILIGHVPPARTESKQSWDESCYQKYTLWLRQYRDVIVGSVFGHMNLDHFMFQDVKDLAYKFVIDGIDDEFTRPGRPAQSSNDDLFTTAAKVTYLNELREDWSSLPQPPDGSSYPTAVDGSDPPIDGESKKQTELKKFLAEIGGPWAERYSLSLVSPSVVPNFYPTLRIIEYNITGLEDEHPATKAIGVPADVRRNEQQNGWGLQDWDTDHLSDPSDSQRDIQDNIHELKKKKKKGKKGKKKLPKPKFPVPEPPAKTTPPGPAYSPQTLSLISWTQYYANLTKINDDFRKGPDVMKKKHPAHFTYDVEYTTNDGIYQMKDLTMRSWLDLAERIGRKELKASDDSIPWQGMDIGMAPPSVPTHIKDTTTKTKQPKNHVWRAFVKRAYVHTKPEEELEDSFG